MTASVESLLLRQSHLLGICFHGIVIFQQYFFLELSIQLQFQTPNLNVKQVIRHQNRISQYFTQLVLFSPNLQTCLPNKIFLLKLYIHFSMRKEKFLFQHVQGIVRKTTLMDKHSKILEVKKYITQTAWHFGIIYFATFLSLQNLYSFLTRLNLKRKYFILSGKFLSNITQRKYC